MIILVLIFDFIAVIKLDKRDRAESGDGELGTQLDLLPNIRFGLNLLPSSGTGGIFALLNLNTPSPTSEEELVIEVWDKQRGAFQMELEEYVFHVLAAEMPATYEQEALKAQAVAARTFVLHGITEGSSCKSGCTVCTDYSCCQAFISDAELHSMWGEKYEVYRNKLMSAVETTKGEVIVSGGKVISALYHASSGGRTEDCEAVFAVALPYLVSVESEGEEEFSQFSSEKRFDFAQLCEKVNSAYPDANLSEPDKQIDIWARTDSGRVKLVQLGETVISGQQLRSLLQLRSTNFTFEFEDETVIITCLGFGHGVGMSQCGADAMAKQGASYEQILKHYYTGTELTVYMQTGRK